MEFEHYLADRLSVTVEWLRSHMSNDEYVRWGIYHARKAQREELAAKRTR